MMESNFGSRAISAGDYRHHFEFEMRIEKDCPKENKRQHASSLELKACLFHALLFLECMLCVGRLITEHSSRITAWLIKLKIGQGIKNMDPKIIQIINLLFII